MFRVSLELFPRQAQYFYGVTNPVRTTGGRVRHYENIKVASCNPVTVLGTFDISGAWLGTDCVYSRRPGAYVDYYTFNVSSSRNVFIDLRYTDRLVDTCLYLFSGINASGTPLAFNDDYGGTLNSSISGELGAGSYTIAAATYGAGRAGDYRLRVCNTVNVSPPVASISNSWISADCESTRRPPRYVGYYTFTIDGLVGRQVQIDLESSIDTYMYLIAGNGSGTLHLASDDDGGESLNSRITQTLVTVQTWGEVSS